MSPRSVIIGLSDEWLEAVGVPEDLEDNDLEELVDEFVKDNATEFSVALQEWLDERVDG